MNEILKPFRKKIDSLDDQIVDLLVAREKIIHEVATLKKEHDIPAVLKDRVEEVLRRCTLRAMEGGSSGDYINAAYQTIIEESCVMEERLFQTLEKKNS